MGLFNKNKLEKGFTIVELTIATGVFSIILLLSLVGFMQIGKLFYKGVNITRTNDVAKQTINSLKGDVSFDVLTTSYSPQNDPETSTTPQTDRFYFCAGTSRYTYIEHKALDADAEAVDFAQSQAQVPGWINFGLLKDQVASGCPAPFSSGTGTEIDKTKVTELLGDKMRLSDIEITRLPSPKDKLYTIAIKIAYGEDSVFQGTTELSDNPICESDSSLGSSFCFVSSIKTVVRKGL